MVTIIENTTQPYDSDVTSDTRVGESVNDTSSQLYDIYISDCQFYMGSTSGTGTLTCGIFNGTSLQHTFWTKPISELSGTRALTTESSTPYDSRLTVGDYIGVIATDPCKVGMGIADVFDGVHSSWTRNGSPNTSYDTGFRIEIPDTPPAPSPSTRLPPPPITVRF